MLNSVIMMGRLVTDPEARKIQGEDSGQVMVRYSLAVERDYKRNGTYPVDFFTCKVFGGAAQYASEYMRKGDLVVVSGNLITERYLREDEERERTFICIYVQKNYLVKKKRENVASGQADKPTQKNMTQVFPEEVDETLLRDLDMMGM